MRKKRVFLIILVIVILFFVTLILPFVINPPTIGPRVAVIDIPGIITKSDATIKLIHTYRDDPNVKAIVLRINSPGGSVAPVQEIHRELTKLDKPIVASMAGSAASGGYYIACAADTIIANPGTLTGSIGVIMQFTKLKGLYEKVGLEQQVIKSGQFKDAGSMFRDLSAEDKAILQETVDDVYNQFVDAIHQSRNEHLTRDEIVELADGRIYSGNQALSHKLIDQIGNLQDAIGVAGKLGKIEGTPKILRKERRSSLLEQLIGIEHNSQIDNLISFPGVTFRYELSLSD